MASDDRNYTSEEAEAILKLASKQQNVGGISREQLLHTASELGISPEAVASAEAEYRVTRQEAAGREQVLSMRRQFMEERRITFATHLGIYLLINLGLVLTWYFSDRGYFWPMWPLLGWGIGMLAHGLTYFSGQQAEAEFQTWLTNKQLKLANRQMWLTGDHASLVSSIVAQSGPSKLLAIKYLREASDCSLQKALDDIDDYARQHPGTFSVHQRQKYGPR